MVKLISMAAASIILCMALVALAMAASGGVAAADVEHTFVVTEMKMRHLCNETLVTVVNGQLPGPTIEVTEEDSVAVHVVNKSPHNITIHWHGLKQRLNCWADGVPAVTQCPIRPGRSFTYRLNVTGQEGTLWWHAHVSCIRAILHGAFVIRPRHGRYPFPKPHKEIPIVIGEWWSLNLAQLAKNMEDGYYDDSSSATTINGKLGDLYSCSGGVEDGFVLDVEPGKTYLLRLLNAALYSEYFVKIAGHRFTVVGADANYVRPFATDVVAVGPGETVDALVLADAPPGGSYYMVAVGGQAPKPDIQIPETRSRATLRYTTNNSDESLSPPPVAPDMPDQHDFMVSFNFHGNLRGSPGLPPVPARADESLFVVLRMGSVCRGGRPTCARSGSKESVIVETMNNVSFRLPAAAATTPLLEAHYYRHRTNGTAAGGLDELRTLPDRPARPFNFTDRALIPWGPNEAWLEPTEKAAVARRFRHGAVVDMVFQNAAVMDTDNHPMHLHRHDMFVLAQGLDNYDAARDVAKYNLVDPPLKNTVLVPRLGWAAVRFVADNPGVWYMHCHYELHVSIGMAAVFIIEDGPTLDTALPPPPQDFPKCDE